MPPVSIRSSSAVTTRFLLILDPDFFIVRRDWIADCLAHMQAHELSFFGAAHHPRRPTKFRYFPSVMCTFVDLSRVDRHDLDFNPGTYHAITAAGRRERHDATSRRTAHADDAGENRSRGPSFRRSFDVCR